MTRLERTLDILGTGGETVILMTIANAIVHQWTIEGRAMESKADRKLLIGLQTHGIQEEDIQRHWRNALTVAQLAANLTDYKYPRGGEGRHD